MRAEYIYIHVYVYAPVSGAHRIRTANCHHTYPKTDGLQYSLAFNHNSYSYPTTLIDPYRVRYRGTTPQAALRSARAYETRWRAQQLLRALTRMIDTHTALDRWIDGSMDRWIDGYHALYTARTLHTVSRCWVRYPYLSVYIYIYLSLSISISDQDDGRGEHGHLHRGRSATVCREQPRL